MGPSERQRLFQRSSVLAARIRARATASHAHLQLHLHRVRTTCAATSLTNLVAKGLVASGAQEVVLGMAFVVHILTNALVKLVAVQQPQALLYDLQKFKGM